MPYGDGTGPSGMGSMTGRAAGYCAGHTMPGYANRYPGSPRYGRGGGGGRGHRNWYYATGLPGWSRARMNYPAWGGFTSTQPYVPEMSPEREADMLKNQAQMMQEEINSINERIKEIETMKEKKK